MFHTLLNIVMIAGGLILAIVAVLFIVRLVMRRGLRSTFGAGTHKVFLVLLPREQSKDKDAQIDQPSQDIIRQQISQAESIMAAIGGLKASSGGMQEWMFGSQKSISFEIVSHKGLISFYAVFPNDLASYMIQQIRSSYKDIELEEVEDYNIFSASGVVKGAYITQKGKGYLPIKTYMQFDGDPMENVTNVLSKLNKDESAAIQFVMKSAPKAWHAAGRQAVARIKRGEELFEAPGSGIAKALSGAGKVLKESAFGAKKDQFGNNEDDKLTRLTPKEEEAAKMIEDKNAKAGINVNIRVIVSSTSNEQAKAHLDNLINNFSQYNIYEYGNSLVKTPEKIDALLEDFIFRNLSPKKQLILNTEEMISLIHFPLGTTTTPNIHWLTSRKAPAPVNLPTEGITLGINVYRSEERVVHMDEQDRRRHVYIIGTTGVGKSNLMYHMALQDIEMGRGVGVVDPHGDFVEYLLENMPAERYEDVVVFDPSQTEHPIGLNMLEAETANEKDFVAQEMIQIFYKLVTDPSMIGPMFEHYMRNAMLTLMANAQEPGTLMEVPRIFTDDEYRKSLMPYVTDPVVRAFWEKEMAQTSGQSKSDMLGYLISKVGRFIENEMMRNIIGQPHSSINFKKIMREGKIVLVNLSKGRIGDINSMLMGLIVVSKIQMAAFAQANLPESERKDFYLYIDEFQNYTTDSIATILSEARKYKLNLTMAHQYLGQLVKNNDTSIRDAVLGNVGTIMSFRIGVEDAPTISQIMAPVFGEYDLVNLERYNVYTKMLVHNTVQRAFSMKTYPPKVGETKRADLLKELSSRKYGRPREQVEKEILERSQLGESLKKASLEDVEATL